MPIAIYARKSIEGEDRQIQSLEDQVRELRSLARREGLPSPVIYQEARSAKEPGRRPEFERLMEEVAAGRIAGILTWSMSRLARNPVDGGLVAYRLQTGRLPFIRTPERTYRPEDNALLLSIENGMATAFLQDLSRNVSRGMRGKVERGWHSSKAPVGYRNEPETREIVRDGDRWDLVRRGWDLVLRGENVGEVHRRLVSAGLTVRSRRGKPGPISRARLHTLFREPFYSGQLVYKGEFLPARHEPMVTPDEFALVQERISRPRPTKRPKEAFAFSGTLTCAVCGCAVVGERKTKVYPRTGRAATYLYYHCSGSKGCTKRAVREEELAAAALPVLRRAAITPGFAGWLRDSLAAAAERSAVDGAQGKAELQREAGREEARLRQLTAMRLDEEVSPEEYASARREILARRERAEEALERARGAGAAALARIAPVLKLAEATERELPTDPDPASIGRLLRWGGEHLLNPIDVEFRIDPVLAKIAALEPAGIGSPRPERGDLVPLDSVWWTLVEDLLRIGADQSSEAESERVRRGSGR